MTSIFADTALLAEGWAHNVRLELADGKIVALEPSSRPKPDDERVHLLLPGMGNLHSHAFQRAMAGLTEKRGEGQDSFWTWRELMYRFALTMSPEESEAVAALLYVEMLEAGFTRVGEFHYLHHASDGSAYANVAEMAGRIAAAAADTGIGLTLLPVFYAHSGFGGAPPNAGQRRFISDLDGFAKLHAASREAISRLPGAVLGLAPHSLRAVTPAELAALLPMASGGPIHIHVAEQIREVEDCLVHTGRRPVQWLLENAPVDGRWCLIHATHMTAAETHAFADSGAVAGLCPITEANLGDGLFNAPEFLAAGGALGIGSDSNVEIGLGAELKLLEYGQRLRLRVRNVLGSPSRSTGRELYERALEGGAQALGAGGHLLPGGTADFVTLQPRSPDIALPKGDGALDALIFAPGSVQVDQVFVAGRRVVAGGRHIAREGIERRFAQAMRRLLD